MEKRPARGAFLRLFFSLYPSWIIARIYRRYVERLIFNIIGMSALPGPFLVLRITEHELVEERVPDFGRVAGFLGG